MTWPIFLILFYGFTLSGVYSLGKLVAVGWVGAWLAFGGVKRIGLPVLYLAVLTLTTITSADPWVSIWHLWGTNTCGLLAALVLVPFWACVGPGERGGIENGLRVGGLLMAVIGLLQLVPIPWLTPFPLFTGNRVYSTLGSPIYLGAVAVLCFPFMRSKIEQGLIVAVLLASGSRGAWIATALGWAYLNWDNLSPRVRTWGSILGLAGITGAFWYRPLSDLGRVVTWGAALDGFMTRPWFGWGAGNFYTVAAVFRTPAWDEAYGNTTQDHAHNLFLEAASTSGVLGLLGISVLLFSLWKNSDRIARSSLLGVFVVGMLNPLPMVAKALCLALAASSKVEEINFRKTTPLLVKGVSAISFLAVAWLIHLDRMMTFYGDVPWGFYSAKAAYYTGLIKEKIERRQFKL